jgi:eukaryotic-like serine/threonine-protein kinase
MAPLPPDSCVPEYGSRVGPWIVRERSGSGSHGTVFRVVRADKPEAGSYALKVALEAEDERFEREAWLLSRIRHPSVPRFEDSGTWKSPRGEAYPYLVMQWVEGMKLYAWAEEHGLTLRQAIGQLAQLARALEATHRHGVHRDVKGGNVRVSPEGHAVLLDFGCCWYPHASPLTGRAVPPGTDNYRSPGLLLFEYALNLGAEGHYVPEPEDDVYALGVTAYRLLAGAYPPSGADCGDGSKRVVPLEAPRGLEDKCPELGELIVRMLSEDPKARGSAKQVAEELEALREYSRPALDEPWVANASRQPTQKAKPPVPPENAPPPVPHENAPPPVPREHPGRVLAPRLALAGSGLVLALLGVLLTRDVDRTEVAYTEPESEPQSAEKPDAGTSVGEEGLASAAPSQRPPVPEGKVTRKMPDEPHPQQRRPPCTPEDVFVEIKGGCWMPRAGSKPPCETDWYEYNGRCYFAVPARGRPPTSKEPW